MLMRDIYARLSDRCKQVLNIHSPSMEIFRGVLANTQDFDLRDAMDAYAHIDLQAKMIGESYTTFKQDMDNQLQRFADRSKEWKNSGNK